MSELTKAAQDVLAERERQTSAEGWSHDHDDDYDCGELADAAACYASPYWLVGKSIDEPPHNWPWDASWWKPRTPREDLVRAGALILAEIERLDRATLKASDQ